MRTFYVDNTPYAGHHTGTAQGGSNNPPSVTLSAACDEPNGAYVDWGVRIVSGTGAGQSLRITAYSNITRVAQVESPWTTVPDATSVYAVTFGCDTNMGMYRVLGSGGPFASLDRPLATAEPGDTVYVKAGTPYTWNNGNGAAATIRCCGDPSYPIRVLGYKSQPGDASGHWGDDAYRAVLDGGGALTNLISVDPELVVADFLGYEFAHLRFVHALEAGVAIGLDAVGVTFCNCVAGDNGGHGFYLGTMSCLVGCEAEDNGGCGIVAGGGTYLDNCRVHGNGDHQISVSGLVEFTTVYGIPDGKNGIRLNGLASAADTVRNCGVDGTRSSGSNTGICFCGRMSVLVNTIVYRCGVGVAGADAYRIAVSRNNLYADNVVSRQNWPADEAGAVTGDPKFMDAGAHDYRLQADSPGAGAGWPASMDLGASQRQAIAFGSPTNMGMQT